jgi:hypothetical protein
MRHQVLDRARSDDVGGADALTKLAARPVLLAAFTYWDGKRAGRAMTERRDIDPLDMPRRLLPNLALGELIGGEMTGGGRATLRLRVVGTEIAARLGVDGTGKRLRDVLAGEFLDYVESLVTDVSRHCAPVYSDSILCWGAEHHLRTQRIYLPLSTGGDRPSMVLIAQEFEAAPPDRKKPAAEIPLAGSLAELERTIISTAGGQIARLAS